MKAKNIILLGVALIVLNFLFPFMTGILTVAGVICIGWGVVKYLDRA